jgi:hypothetical protein
MSEKPDVTPCPACGEPSLPLPSCPAGFVGIANTVSRVDPPRDDSAPALRYEPVECMDCHHRSTHFYADGVLEAEPCEKCGSWKMRVYVAETIMSELQFPYWDEFLGVEITSPDHRRRVKREKGVEEMSDHDAKSVEQLNGPRHEWQDRVHANAVADQKHYATDPALAKFRAWQADGGLDRYIAEALGPVPTHLDTTVYIDR